LLMKRNDGDLPAPFEPGEGLADKPITRSRAMKLFGAMGATGAFALFTGGTAEAGERDRRRRRRRRRRLRRRRRNVTTTNNTTDNSTVNFGDSLVGTPVTETVEVTNNGDTPVTIRPEIAGDGFSLVDSSEITLLPGETADVDVVFLPNANDVGQVTTGTLKLVDVDDGLVLEDIELLGNPVLEL
jgi:hypothetical protein